MNNTSGDLAADIERVVSALGEHNYLDGAPSAQGEQRMFCPACEDPDESHSPSASLNVESGLFSCQKSSGEHSGTLVRLVLHLSSRGIDVGTLSPVSRRRVEPKAKTLPKAVGPEVERRLEKAELRFEIAEESPAATDHLRFLEKERGLRWETIREWRLGVDYSSRDEEWRIWIPVIIDGQIVNVRRYKMRAAGDKMLSISGHGSGALILGADLLTEYPDLPVLMCESELDCILANQEAVQPNGSRLYVAVTGTGGASTVPANIDLLRGRDVCIAYDADQAGREGARKVAAALAKIDTAARVLDLATLGLQPDSGEDITDLLMRHQEAVDLATAMAGAEAAEHRPRFVRVSAAQLAEPVPPMEWLVEDVWAEGGYGVYGGAKKTLKTYNLIALALAVSSGAAFLGRFNVPRARPVIMYLSEGGDKGTRRRLHSIAEWMNVNLAELPLTMVFDSAPIGSPELTQAVQRDMRELRPGLVIVDALYAFHAHDIEVANLYARGQMLRDLEQMIVAQDRALIVADHFSKLRSKELDLDAISQSGVAEWAHSWALSKHRSSPDVAAGDFKLAVQYGGRDGYGADYAIDWHLGPRGADGLHAGPVSVDVSFLTESEAPASSPQDRIFNALRDVMQRHPFEYTRDEIVRQVTGGNSARREAFDLLAESPGVEQQTIEREDTSGRSRRTVVWGAFHRIPLTAATAAGGGGSPGDAKNPTDSAGDTPPDSAAVNRSDEANSESFRTPPEAAAAYGGVSRSTPLDLSRRKGSVRRRKSGGERR